MTQTTKIERMLDPHEVDDKPVRTGIHNCPNCGTGSRLSKQVTGNQYIEKCEAGCDWMLKVPIGLDNHGNERLVMGMAAESGVQPKNTRKLDRQ